MLALVTLAGTAPASPLTIVTKQLPPDTNGVPYNQAINVTGGQQPYKWKVLAGSFPDGLALDASNGTVSGISHAAAWELQYPFQAYVSVTDNTGASVGATFNVPLVAPPAGGSSGPTLYSLTVTGGSGGGSYAAGTTVSISAGSAPVGQLFSGWTGATVANPQAANTTLVMPAAATAVTANFQPIPPPVNYSLTVVGGSGSGTYAAGTTVSISAGNAPAGQVFSSWTGAPVANPQALNTTLVMPAAATVVTANFQASAPSRGPLTLSAANLPAAVVGTTYSQALPASGGHPPYSFALSSGSLPPGLALEASSGVIDGTPTASAAWVYAYPYQAYVKVTDAVGATAYQIYKMSLVPPTNVTYTLTVNGGQGGGSYAANTLVTITAVPPNQNSTFTGWSGAAVANASALSTTLLMPAANTSVTANFTSPVPQFQLSVTGGSGGGTYAAGTVITISANPAPAGQVFQTWNGAAVANPSATTTTLVMPSQNAAVTAVFAPNAPATIPQPVASHPRLWLTTNDLPRLRNWASATNPIYTQGILVLLNKAIHDYNTLFFPGGVANPNYPDPGDINGYGGVLTENYVYIFGLNALIDPNPANRSQYAQYARNLIMYAMDQAVQGDLPGAPFRDPNFCIGNRANFFSETWPLIVDWLYDATDTNGVPIFSATDKTTIRQVFLMWDGKLTSVAETGGNPEPAGTLNSPALLPGGNAFRMAANNYYTGHARLVTMTSLAFDPADDPPLNPALPVSSLGNSLRSYIADATGAWLYQQYAMYGDPANVRSDFHLPASASVGLASGGLPPEGMLYGHSYSYLLGELLALKTAGFATPQLGGPQTVLANNAPIWDRFVQGMISSLTPLQAIPTAEPYDGLTYEFASYGDILRMWPTPDFGNLFAFLGLLDQQNGYTNRLNAERWFLVDAVQGGAPALLQRMSDPWSWGVQNTIMAFLFMDPSLPAPTDPHADYPVTFFDPSPARLVDRTDWGQMATMFDYRASWQSINHQEADAGQFEFYRKGEWLTKGVANYDTYENGVTSEFHNTLSLQNWCANGVPTDLFWDEGVPWTNGSSWQGGAAAGDPATVSSFQPGYDFLRTDLTALYNRPAHQGAANAAMDLTDVNRSILWLKPDYIVVYDRATSKHAGLFKRFNFSLVGLPHLTNNVITSTTPGAQTLTVTELLPVNSQLTVFPIAGTLNPIAELEPSKYRLELEDPSLPADTRFLHVFQGTDAGTLPDTASLMQSTSGSSMDGTVFGNTAVWFIHDETVPFAGTSYTVPASVIHHYVTGCVPGAAYAVVSSVSPAGLVVTITPATSGFMADQAGVLQLDF